MGNSILVPLNDSISSKGVVNYLVNMSLCPDARITLIHVFRKPSSGEELMGKKFMAELPARFESFLEKARSRLVKEKGFHPDRINTQLITEPYQNVTEAIIDYFKKGKFDMVVIGRKKMSKSEEFILGDISVKLIRELENTAILVVKSS